MKRASQVEVELGRQIDRLRAQRNLAQNELTKLGTKVDVLDHEILMLRTRIDELRTKRQTASETQKGTTR